MSLLTRLFLLVALAVLPLIAVDFYHDYTLRADERVEMERHALTLTHVVAVEGDRLIGETREWLATLSNQAAVLASDPATCRLSLARLRSRHPEIAALIISDDAGRPICADHPMPAAFFIGDTRYLDAATRTGAFAVGGYDAGYGARPVLPMALAFDGLAGHRGGVLIAALSLDWLNGFFADQVSDPAVTIGLVDRDGVFLVAVPARSRVGTRATGGLLASLQSDRDKVVEVAPDAAFDGRGRLLGVAPLVAAPNALWANVGLAKSPALFALDDAGRRAAFLAVVGLILTLGVAGVVGRVVIGRPIGALLAAAQRWSRGEYRVRVAPSGGGSDFARLGVAFNELVDAIDRREREQDEAEAAVRRSEERYRSLISATTAIVWTMDAQGRFTEPQPSWQAFTGQPWPAQEGLRWAEMIHPDDRAPLVGEFRGAIGRGAVFETVGRIWHAPGGAWRDFVARAVPVRAPDGHIREWIGAATDVTERRRAEEALKRLTETLETRVIERTAELAEANRRLSAEIVERREAEAKLEQVQRIEAIGQLTSGVAHDFNNLLTAILGNLELAQMRLANHPAARSLETAVRAAERGATLVSQLLAFARKQRLEPKPVDINRLIRGVSDLLGRTIGPTIVIEQNLADGLWPALVDPSQIELVLLNLSINARDAMAEGGRLVIETRNHLHRSGGIAELRAGEYVVLSVSDTGCGMNDDVLARAFEPFFTTKDVGKGSGLGLSMVYGVVRQSGGGVEIDSTVGRGTTIRVYLPRAQAVPETLFVPPAIADHYPLGGARLLLVDDDASVREVTRLMLAELGCAVTEAGSGADALALLDLGLDVDVLVADVAMPGMNGPELVRQIRKRQPGIAILMITGYADPALADEAAGTWLTLRKPFRRNDLAAAVARAMGSDRRTTVIPFRLPAAGG